MNDFDAVLTRAFAEAPEPADNGFTLRVTDAVARSERFAKAYQWAQSAGVGLAGITVLAGVFGLAGGFGQELLGSLGLEVARAHGAINEAPSFAGQAQNMYQSLSAGILSQGLAIMAALAGGAVAYRTIQDN